MDEAAPPPGKFITVLSIDGGGIKGLIPATILTFLESQLQVISLTNSFPCLSATNLYLDFGFSTETWWWRCKDCWLLWCDCWNEQRRIDDGDVDRTQWEQPPVVLRQGYQGFLPPTLFQNLSPKKVFFVCFYVFGSNNLKLVLLKLCLLKKACAFLFLKFIFAIW